MTASRARMHLPAVTTPRSRRAPCVTRLPLPRQPAWCERRLVGPGLSSLPAPNHPGPRASLPRRARPASVAHSPVRGHLSEQAARAGRGTLACETACGQQRGREAYAITTVHASVSQLPACQLSGLSLIRVPVVVIPIGVSWVPVFCAGLSVTLDRSLSVSHATKSGGLF